MFIAAFARCQAINDLLRHEDEREFCQLILYGVGGVHRRLRLWVWYRLDVYPRYRYIADRIGSAINWLMDVFRGHIVGPDNQAALQLQLA